MVTNAELLREMPYAWPAPPFVLDFNNAPLTDEQFDELCRNNEEVSFELSAKGELIVVPPTGPDTSWKNADLIADVTIWARKDGTGLVFDSNGIFLFPNGAKRSPDVAWMLKSKWDEVPPSERRRSTARVVPDFVIELLSPSDSLIRLKEKLEEYIGNGVRLAWLIDPDARKVHVYRANGEVEELYDPEFVWGEDVLPGFKLAVRAIW